MGFLIYILVQTFALKQHQIHNIKLYKMLSSNSTVAWDLLYDVRIFIDYLSEYISFQVFLLLKVARKSFAEHTV